MKQYPEWLARKAPNVQGRVRKHSWADYENNKAQWIAKHPDATHEEYEQAMQRIAKEAGV